MLKEHKRGSDIDYGIGDLKAYSYYIDLITEYLKEVKNKQAYDHNKYVKTHQYIAESLYYNSLTTKKCSVYIEFYAQHQLYTQACMYACARNAIKKFKDG